MVSGGGTFWRSLGHECGALTTAFVPLHDRKSWFPLSALGKVRTWPPANREALPRPDLQATRPWTPGLPNGEKINTCRARHPVSSPNRDGPLPVGPNEMAPDAKKTLEQKSILCTHVGAHTCTCIWAQNEVRTFESATHTHTHAWCSQLLRLSFTAITVKHLSASASLDRQKPDMTHES